MDRARASLAVDDAYLRLAEIDVFPGQGHDLVLAAARQHQQADRCHRPGGYLAAFAGNLVQNLPEAGELGVGEEPLPLAFGVRRDGLAGIVEVVGDQLAVAGEHVHVAQGRDHHVGHRGGFAQALVERHDVAALHRRERQLAEGRHDVTSGDAAGGPLRLRLAAHRNVLFEIAPGQVRHGRAAVVLRGQRKRHRVLSGFDARDDERGPPARLFGVEHPNDVSDCLALPQPRPARLH